MESIETEKSAANTNGGLSNNSSRKQSDMNVSSAIEFSSKEENLHYEGVWDLAPVEVNQKRAQVVLIDVREPDEFTGELGHIPGATLIPLNTLATQGSKIPKDRPIVFVCRSGGRSGKATAWALQAGFTQVYNMKGGMLSWNDLHLPTEI